VEVFFKTLECERRSLIGIPRCRGRTYSGRLKNWIILKEDNKMIRLERSETLGRKIRQDDVADLGVPNLTLVHDAIQAGRLNEALDFLDYDLSVAKATIDSLTLFREATLTRLAAFGEEEIEKIHRERYYPWMTEWLETTAGVEESLQRFSEAFRGLFFDFTITEEPDRYVMKLDLCFTGGKLRRTRNIGTTKKAYPWSWSKSGVSYYCTHCCVFQEIIPIEIRGYPICVTEYPDRPEDPCVKFFYKKPEFIPDEYFTRVGKTPYRPK
jgi:hypothetical protein